MLKINNIHSQQILNNRKIMLRKERRPFVGFPICEWFVEKMLRVYRSVYKYITSTVHQINKFSSTVKPHVI